MTPSVYPFSRETELEPCLAFIVGHPREQTLDMGAAPRSRFGGRAILLAHEPGAGAHTLAPPLAERLDLLAPSAAVSWTVFDRELIDRVLLDPGISKQLRHVVPEEHRSHLRDVLEELRGRRPPSCELVPKVAETVLQLAWAGNAILVGRGTNFITTGLSNVLRIHLCADQSWRARHLHERFHWSSASALEYVRKTDHDHGAYERPHFGPEADDCRAFDLVLRTDRLGLELAEDLALAAAREHLRGVVSEESGTLRNPLAARMVPAELPASLLP